MAKKITAGQFVVSSIRKELGYGRTLASMKVIDMAMAEVIDRTIHRAIRPAYEAGRKSVLDVMVQISGVKDQKLPATWGTITTSDHRPTKAKIEFVSMTKTARAKRLKGGKR